jgi:hypothetical protein
MNSHFHFLITGGISDLPGVGFSGQNKRTGGPEVLSEKPATTAVSDVRSVRLYGADGTHPATVPLPFRLVPKLGVAWTRRFTFFRHFCKSWWS